MDRAPYFAHLEVESFYYGLLGKRSCGAVIIDDLWLATSAYCLNNAERATVQMGSAREPNDTKIVGPTHLVVTVENTNFFQHPNYNRIMSWNDIGKFQYRLKLTENDQNQFKSIEFLLLFYYYSFDSTSKCNSIFKIHCTHSDAKYV